MTILLDEDIEAYHAAPATSNTKLAKFRRRGPAYYFSAYLTPGGIAHDDTPAMKFGRFFDDIMTDPAKGRDKWAITGLDLRTKEGKAWKAENEGKAIVSEEDATLAAAMAAAVHDNPLAAELLKHAQAQVTIRRVIEAYGILAQTRPDFYSARPCKHADAAYTADLKTTDDLAEWFDPTDPESETVSRPILRYGYHRQAALANWLLREETGKETDQFLIVVEKQLPYRVAVVQLLSNWIDLGLREVERDLARLAECFRSGVWPKGPAEILRPVIPSWVSKADERADFWSA